LELMKTRLGSDHPEILGRQVTLGVNYCDAGRFEEGIALIKAVRDQGREDPHPIWVRTMLLMACLQAGKNAEATALVNDRVEEARLDLPADSADLADFLIVNGKLLLDVKAFAEAERLLLEGFHGLQRAVSQVPSDINKQQLRNALESLIQLYETWSKPVEAAKWRHELAAIDSFDPSNNALNPGAATDATGFDEQ